MRASTNKGFTPVKLTIELDTQLQVDKLYALFSNRKVFGFLGSTAVKQALHQHVSNDVHQLIEELEQSVLTTQPQPQSNIFEA